MNERGSLQVTVNLYSILRHIKGEIVNRLEMELPAGSRVQAVLDRLEVPPGLDLIVSVNGRVADVDEPLHDGDRLAVIPALSGG